MSLGTRAQRVRAPADLPSTTVFGIAAAAIVCLHLATNATLGFHTDELYYLTCGLHPSLGYVDFPPVVPLLARVETGLLGVTPWALRLLPSLLGGFLVALCGAYVRKLGGSLRLQAIALLTGICALYLLGSNWVFQTVTFDQVTWMLATYWFLCLAIERRPRYWIYLGVTLGVGLEVKYTIAGLIAGIGAAILLAPSLRDQLRTRYPWIGAALALVIWAPNLLWQAANGFPSLAYLANHGGAISSGGGPRTYVIEFAVLILCLLAPLWLAGMVSLWRSPVLRPVAICSAVPILVFLVAGKSYYAAGTVPIAMAQGLMAISRIERRRLRSGLLIAVVLANVLQFAIFFRAVVPVTPPSQIHAAGLDALNEVFADSVGWDDVARQVTTLYESLPAAQRPDTVIVSRYYGVPGALRFYGGPAGVPAVVSPQLSDWYWLPAHVGATFALMVDYRPSDVAWMCTSPRLVGQLSVPYHVKGLEQGAPVTLCRLNAPLADYWLRLRDFS